MPSNGYYGGFINRVMEDYGKENIEVGDGATLLLWSDRRAFTIVAVERYVTGKHKGEVKAVFAQADKAIRTDSNGMSESQSYRYEPNPDAEIQKFTKRKDGRFRKENSEGNTVLAIIGREEYHDYSF
jgi:hypothetical protein